jgi:hypothetical protein
MPVVGQPQARGWYSTWRSGDGGACGICPAVSSRAQRRLTPIAAMVRVAMSHLDGYPSLSKLAQPGVEVHR